jgi:PAS domain S-box-containing protein
MMAAESVAYQLRTHGLVLAGTFLLLAAIFALAAIAIVESRERAQASGEIELNHIASSAADQIGRVFDSASRFQRGLVERIQRSGPTSSAEFARLVSDQEGRRILETESPGLPQVGGVAYIDDKGKILNHTPLWPLIAAGIADDNAFAAVRSDPRSAVALSEPKYNRIRNAWFVILIQRVSDPNGGFVGAVALSISLDHLTRIADMFSSQPGVSISLFENGAVRLVPPPDGASASTAPSPTPAKSTRLRRGAGEVANADGPQERFAITHAIPQYGLLVVTTATTEALHAGWHLTITAVTIAALLSIVLVGAGLFHAMRKSDWAVRPQPDNASAADVPKLDVVLESAPIGISVFDRERRLVASNKHYAEIYGFAPEQVVPGTTLSQIVEYHIADGTYEGDSAEDYREKAASDALARVASSMQVYGQDRAAIEALGGPWSRSLRRLKNGRVIALNRGPMPDGGWVGTHEDVTQYEDLRHEHDRSLELIGNIVENLPVMLFVKEAQSLRYLLINRVGEGLFGLPRDQIIGKTAAEIFSKEQAAAITAEESDFLASSEKKRVFQRPRVMFNGTKLHQVTRVKVGGYDEPRFILCIVEEIAEQQTADDDLRRSA